MMILMDFPYIPLLIGYYYLVSWGLHGITLTHSRGTDQPTIMRCDDSLDDSYPPRNERQKRCRREFLLLYFFLGCQIRNHVVPGFWIGIPAFIFWCVRIPSAEFSRQIKWIADSWWLDNCIVRAINTGRLVPRKDREVVNSESDNISTLD